MDAFFRFFVSEFAPRRRRRFPDRVKYRAFRFLLLATAHSGKYSRNRANSKFADSITRRLISFLTTFAKKFSIMTTYMQASGAPNLHHALMAKQTLSVQRYKGEMLRPRRPFWLPASNYYVLAAATVIGVFFLAWGILQDGGEPSPWITAGVLSSAVLIGAVILREVVLRSARNRFRTNQRRLDQSLQGFYGVRHRAVADKLTLEKNAAILAEIKRKSDAAKVLGRFAEGHREVVDMCLEYMSAAERELPNVGVGSPRIAALSRGKDLANKVHHFHLLQWAEIESRTLTQEANSQAKPNERLETAQKAVGVVDFALNYYPHDRDLLDSKAVLSEFVASIKLSHLIEKAERAAFKGSHDRALKHYNDALFLLRRENTEAEDTGPVAEKIESEMQRIRLLSGGARPSRDGRNSNRNNK